MAMAAGRLIFFPLIFTQGRLRCTQQHDSVHCLAGSNPGSYASGPPREVLSVVAQYQVSTENGSYAPCHWSAPGILNPQHPP